MNPSWAGVNYKGRCKTGWRIRKDRLTGNWEAYCRGSSRAGYRQFPSQRRALGHVLAQIPIPLIPV